jgi:hypothetical protein
MDGERYVSEFLVSQGCDCIRDMVTGKSMHTTQVSGRLNALSAELAAARVERDRLRAHNARMKKGIFAAIEWIEGVAGEMECPRDLDDDEADPGCCDRCQWIVLTDSLEADARDTETPAPKETAPDA